MGLDRPLSVGAPKGEGEREEGVPALAVSATNAARSPDSTRRLGLAGSCESWTHQCPKCCQFHNADGGVS